MVARRVSRRVYAHGGTPWFEPSLTQSALCAFLWPMLSSLRRKGFGTQKPIRDHGAIGQRTLVCLRYFHSLTRPALTDCPYGSNEEQFSSN